jgi:flagellar basal-body rod protein FlgG
MLRGIYTAASAMGMQMDAVGVFAHNLANAGTTGYKRSELMSQSFPSMMVQMGGGGVSPLGLGVGTEAALLDQSQGAMKNTENPMDVAIEGDGYFSVRKANGQPDITRDGAFGLDPQKRLITRNGDVVLGQNGQPIQFIEGVAEQIRFQPDGTITEAGQQIGKLAIVQGKPSSQGLAPALRRYVTTVENGGAIRQPQIRQGFLEESNVSIVKEMVSLLGSQKNYDVGQKLIQASDKMLDKVINEMGR